MQLRGWLRRKVDESKIKKEKLFSEMKKFLVVESKQAIILPAVKDISKMDVIYPLLQPFAYASIKWNDEEKCLVYNIIQPGLTPQEQKIYKQIEEGLSKTLEIDLESLKKGAKLLDYIQERTKHVLDEYGVKLKKGQYTRLMYYVYINFIGLNEIEPLMHDEFIEDIGCDGVNIPLYIIHKKYGSLKTNVIFKDEERLKNFVVKLAERSGRYISYAEPLLDGSLPDGSRVQATLAKDVTTKGPTFSIRRFRKVPYSVIDLMELGTASSEVLAYLWFAIEHQKNILVSGGTGAGKTSFLNAIVTFIPPEDKIVSIEDTRELNIPHQNWIPSVARVGFGVSVLGSKKYGEVSMFDLLKESFRQNPDYVIVGEVRGEEASVLFQGMASGHPSFGTIHAGSVDEIIKRLETPPINLSPGLIEALDIVIIITHALQFGKSARRVKELVSIEDVDSKTGKARESTIFSWSPLSDKFMRDSGTLLEKISTEQGIPLNDIENSIKERNDVLKWLHKNKISGFVDVARYISMYYKERDKLMKVIKKDRID